MNSLQRLDLTRPCGRPLLATAAAADEAISVSLAIRIGRDDRTGRAAGLARLSRVDAPPRQTLGHHARSLEARLAEALLVMVEVGGALEGSIASSQSIQLMLPANAARELAAVAADGLAVVLAGRRFPVGRAGGKESGDVASASGAGATRILTARRRDR